jgi:hypothetical protein
LTKNGLPIFWETFSQTHLVTLLLDHAAMAKVKKKLFTKLTKTENVTVCA